MQLPSNLSVSQKTKESLLYKSGFLEKSQHSEFKSTPIKDHSTINPLKVKKKIKTFSVTILKHGWFQETHVTKPILVQLCFQAPAYFAVNDLIAKAPTTTITLRQLPSLVMLTKKCSALQFKTFVYRWVSLLCQSHSYPTWSLCQLAES